MTLSVYVDTSALVKWYLRENRSEDVVAFLAEACPVFISTLTQVEMRSLLARRRRRGDIDALLENRVFSTFNSDIAAGHLVLLPRTVEPHLLAESLIGSLPEIPLRTLDALHLGAAQTGGLGALATADRVMAQAALALGLECHTFY